MAKFGVGQPVTRTEDNRFLTGHGRYTDDLSFPGQAHAVMVRSPHAAARIRSIDLSAAKAVPGVLGAWSGADAMAAGLGVLPCLAMLPNKDGSEMVPTVRPLIAVDRVRFVGDTVAFIVAETLAIARDAAELVEVDYEVLPSVTDTAAALQSGAAAVWDEVPNNLALDWEIGDRAAVDAAFAKAAHVTTVDLVNNRAVCCAMEPRAANAIYDAEANRTTLYCCTQGTHLIRGVLAQAALNIPPEELRVVTYDVGGGFGTKAFPYAEYPLVAFAAKALRRPVKWTGDRSDAFLTDLHGRDHVTRASIALDANHKFLGVKVETVAAMGAYLSAFAPFIPTFSGAQMHVGTYAIPSFYTGVKLVYTNTTPVDAYRGAGRPEAAYVIERLVDAAAREVGISGAEIRRRNFIPADAFPFSTSSGLVYDSGDFQRNLDDALAMADEAGFAARKAESKRKGLARGLGIAYYIEKTGADPNEFAEVTVGADGVVTAHVGTQSTGQGHETAFAQMLADRLGVPFDQIRIEMGDSDRLKGGNGTGGSRSLALGGGAIMNAGDAAVDKGKEFAAEALEVAAADISYAEGKYRVVGTDKTIDLFAVAKIAASKGNEPGLVADAVYVQEANTFPNGCHVCEVEVDPATGVIDIVRYSVCDDFGKVVNPLLLAGQVHGGIVQGIGQALTENVVYDPDSGQMLTGSFMDYCPPRADLVPSFAFKTNEIPCRTNPMGIKGAGEAGTIGAPPALVNAVVDALAEHGIRHIDMPLTPLRVWQAVQGSATRQAAE
jgi:carbon-monoxide dehydrogenase large subunit